MQGMPFVVGFLQMHMTEEEAFWTFVEMNNNKKYNLKDVYRSGLPYLRMLMYVLDRLVKIILPEVHNHLVGYIL